jgi:hypothetical protein
MSDLVFSEARDRLADVFDAALSHLPTPIVRRRSGVAVLISVDDLLQLVSGYRFSPEVFFEPDDTVSIWLPELALYGRGSSIGEARDDLLDEVREYLAAFAEDARLRAAPNHLQRLPWVARAMLLDRIEDGLSAALFEDPADHPD